LDGTELVEAVELVELVVDPASGLVVGVVSVGHWVIATAAAAAPTITMPAHSQGDRLFVRGGCMAPEPPRGAAHMPQNDSSGSTG
jgi:hypothetical protein